MDKNTDMKFKSKLKYYIPTPEFINRAIITLILSILLKAGLRI
jgi:hypothetical protein